MGLDVYAGPLTRYYLGQWQTIVQQTSGAWSWRSVVARTRRGPQARQPWPVLQQTIEAWRTRQAALAGVAALEWDESPAAAVETDKPDWAGYTGLLLVTAYAEHRELDPPTQVPAAWDQDPAWLASSAADFQTTRFEHVLRPELWLPGRFPRPFWSADPTGRELVIGSLESLLSGLREVNDELLRGSPADLASWRREGIPDAATFEQTARFGLAVLLYLAESAVASRVPLKLDY